MSVRELIPAFSAWPKIEAPNASRFTSVCEDIAARYSDTSPVSERDLDHLVADFTQRVIGFDWGGAKEADVSILFRALSAGRLSRSVLLRDFLIEQARLTQRANLLAALCEGYFEGWGDDKEASRAAAGILRDKADRVPEPYDRVFKAYPETLDTSDGPHSLATRLAEEAKPYDALLAAGFADPHAIGFLTQVSQHFLTVIPPVQTRQDMVRLVGWIRPDNAIGLQGAQLVTSINLLLRPWCLNDPAKADRQFLSDVLVQHFGDPRTEGAHIWQKVDPECLRVMLRWLAGESISAFMDIISTVEQRNPITWRMRRDFWMQMYDEGTVNEAWVALHPAAEREAQRRFEQTNDIALKSFAKQSGKKTNTSLLIMRVGDTVIVEGSQNYRVHIFRNGALQRPELYLDAYKDQEITLEQGNPNTRIHDRPGHWRAWVRKKLP